MLLSNSKISQIVCITGITLVLECLFFSNSFSTEAKTAKNQKNPYEGFPANRRDGGSRGNCIANNKDFIALVPERPVNLMTSVSSQLFFYVPQTEEPKIIEFVLRTKEDKLVHETFIQTTGQGGIMSVEIPDQVKENSEKFEENYHWYLSMICDPSERSRDIVLEGWIKLVGLDKRVKEQMELYSPIEQFNLLQQKDIWYDSISLLAEFNKLKPNVTTLNIEWQQILDSIDLGELADEPFIEGKTVSNFYSIPLKEY